MKQPYPLICKQPGRGWESNQQHLNHWLTILANWATFPGWIAEPFRVSFVRRDKKQPPAPSPANDIMLPNQLFVGTRLNFMFTVPRNKCLSVWMVEVNANNISIFSVLSSSVAQKQDAVSVFTVCKRRMARSYMLDQLLMCF